MNALDPVADADLNLDEPADRYEQRNRRILKTDDDVRKYMLAEGPHPGRLLPWEEIRETLDGLVYYVDLVTDETTWRQEPELNVKSERLYDRPEVIGVPRALYFAGPEARATYFRRRQQYVHFWKIYLSIREHLLF
jgi:hypothetical protein